MTRKLIVITIVATILLIAGMPAITAALAELGLVGTAQTLRAEYVTGTAIAVILALLILLPRRTIVGLRIERPDAKCPVCEQRIDRAATYCPQCGSRVA